MIKLYGGGGTRWVRPYWTLRELDIPFEKIAVNLMKGEGQKPAFLALNPFGKVPAIEDGDFHLFESAAICTYLADKYPEKGLIPKAGTHERALCDQWMSFAISDFEQPLWRITRHKYLYPEAKRSAVDIVLAKEDFRIMANALESQIKSDFLVGGKFSIADIVLTYVLKWATAKSIHGEDLTDGFPKLQNYMRTHMARPKFPTELYS